MNSYERVLVALRHKRPDRPPLELFATYDVIASLCNHMKAIDAQELLTMLGIDFRTIILGIKKSQPIPPHISNRYGGDAEIEANCYGIVFKKHINCPQGHCIHGPFYDKEDLDNFDWPTSSDIQTPEMIASEITHLNDKGYCTLVSCDNPFKIAYFMRPYEEFLIDCLVRPEYASELLRRIAAIEFSRAENGVKAGARSAMIFGDFAHQYDLMISPATFKLVLKPILADFVSRLRNINPDILVFLHSDGNLFSILPDLIECGFNAVHPIQPECMDMALVKRLYGKQLTIFGGLSVQSELPGSHPERIRSLVRDRIDLLGEGGGLIFAPTNTIMGDVPNECIVAMYDEAGRLRT